MSTLLLVLLAANAAILLATVLAYRRVKKAQRKRRVEGPNSQYKSSYVLDLEARERWESLELERLHPLNREELERLLAKLRDQGVRALAPPERAFLDRMAEAEARARAPRAGRGGGPGRQLQLPGTS